MDFTWKSVPSPYNSFLGLSSLKDLKIFIKKYFKPQNVAFSSNWICFSFIFNCQWLKKNIVQVASACRKPKYYIVKVVSVYRKNIKVFVCD